MVNIIIIVHAMVSLVIYVAKLCISIVVILIVIVIKIKCDINIIHAHVTCF